MYHQQAEAQPVPEQWLFWKSSPSYIAEHGVIWHGPSLCSVWVSCPHHVPS